MEISKIPFIEHLNIKNSSTANLSIQNSKNLHNHLGSIHAGALYTLAETQSAIFLQNKFPDLKDNIIPLLREGTIKYKKQALNQITAYANTYEEDIEKFLKLFNKKGRGSIEVSVELKDKEGELCAVGRFVWFVQSVDCG
jgi:acyl-coenzyme A thioesterase PaaI-like protein